jgi:hypothetical protein
MQTQDFIELSLASYFRPTNVCGVCRKADARTACGSRYCTGCWESINDDLTAAAVEAGDL